MTTPRNRADVARVATIPELNERAEKILSETLEGLAVLERRMLDGKHEFSPATDPADCAVVMEAMREKGWFIDMTGPHGTQGFACIWGSDRGEELGQPAFAPTWTHAVTLAAVRATEGESK